MARVGPCAATEHEPDASCVCTRCQATVHDFEVAATRRSVLWTELINPNADPGALYLDSNFQPDPDYGRTQSLHLVETVERCRRCGQLHKSSAEYLEPDDHA